MLLKTAQKPPSLSLKKPSQNQTLISDARNKFLRGKSRSKIPYRTFLLRCSPQSTLCRILAERVPDLEAFAVLCKWLGQSSDALIGLTSPTNPVVTPLKRHKNG